MRNEHLFPEGNGFLGESFSLSLDPPALSRQAAIGLMLGIALFAFEIFNFDTTRYALGDLLGEANFAGVRWAVILAVAFCAIDFAGLAYLFSPTGNRDEPREVWYLMGAWLLGATMNAMMTWWAVNLTLLDHSFGNEVLSRQQLLEIVPPFVAVLVWLTRILFIAAFSVAGDHFFGGDEADSRASHSPSVVSERPAQSDGLGGVQVPPRRSTSGRRPQRSTPRRDPGNGSPRRTATARMSAQGRQRS